MSLIGQTLKRKRPLPNESRTIKVTGWNGRAYVCESTDAFGPPFLQSEADLAADYGARAEPAVDDPAAQTQLTAAAHAKTLESLKRNPRYSRGTAATPDPLSPEGRFIAAAELAADD